MVAAISSSTAVVVAAAVNPAAGLEAQLQRYQKELSDCVNCDSANTAAGKETIQAISAKISGVRARLEEIAVSKTDQSPLSPSAIGAAGNVVSAGPEPVAAPRPNHGSVGTLVDVFA